MSNCPFCNSEPEPHAVPSSPREISRPVGVVRRAWHGVQWVFPTALLVLMPKCPLCVAAYIALFTGIGITAATGRWIQVLMLVLCLSALAYLALRKWRRARLKPLST